MDEKRINSVGLTKEKKTHSSLIYLAILIILTIINGLLIIFFGIFAIGGAVADYVYYISAGIGFKILVIGTIASWIVCIFSRKFAVIIAGIALLTSILTFCGLSEYLPEVIKSRY